MNSETNTFFVLIALFLILYGVFAKSWYSLAGGFGLMIITGLDSGESRT